MRIGHGFDVHKFGSNNPLIIGGVRIPYHKGLIAHSDGDLALHAVIDAILGATAQGSIGLLFPDDNMVFKGIDSRKLIHESWRIIQKQGYLLGNLDITIIAQEPKISPYISDMRINIAKDFLCNINNVNIKATTTEQMGFIGRGEGIACEAVVLLVKKYNNTKKE